MGAALVTTREGLEAVANRRDRPGLSGQDREPALLPRSSGSARPPPCALSILTGAALFFTVGELEGRSEQIFEGIAMFSAVARPHLDDLLDAEAGGEHQEASSKRSWRARSRLGPRIGLASVVFFAVLREGWETALFLFAISESSHSAVTAVGANARAHHLDRARRRPLHGLEAAEPAPVLHGDGDPPDRLRGGPARPRRSTSSRRRRPPADRRARVGHERRRQARTRTSASS